jgi:4-hydroxy-tetrahydrodipicolinate reductase
MELFSDWKYMKKKALISQKLSNMNIAIIGYGRMGHEIELIALERGHKISLIIDQANFEDLRTEKLKNVDVAIEFTTPGSAYDNIIRCLSVPVPVVSGTTGWLKDYDKACETCLKNETSFIHSSNFSIGVNMLFRINTELARLMASQPDYTPLIEEIHHVRKLDAPSGTAISLAEAISGIIERFKGWCFESESEDNKIPVRSIREGMVPGIHTVTWNSEIDTLSIRHEAKNRKGLALGAIVAAEFIYSRRGIFTMNDVLGF